MESMPIQSIILTTLAVSGCIFALVVTMVRILKSQLKKELLLEIKKELKLN